MELSTCLNFNGTCEEAFKFYEKCLGGKIQAMMTWGESPMAEHVPSEMHQKIIHVSMRVGKSSILGGDSPPDRFEEAKGFSVTIHFKDLAEADRIFNKLAEGGTIHMPLQETFWAAGFGMFVDRFGTPWMVNSEKAA